MRRSDEGRGKPEEAATVRFVLALEREGLMAIDCVVVDSQPGGHLPPPGHPTTLPLLLPTPDWMSASLRELLRDWADEDAVVDVRLSRGRTAMVARLACADSTMSLAVAGT